MRREWTQLRSSILAASCIDSFMENVASSDCQGKSPGDGELSLAMQLPIGYVMSLMVVDVTAGKIDPSECPPLKPYGKKPLQLLPMRYVGFAGEDADVGPAYLISNCYMESKEPRLFYSDTDIESDWDVATEVATRIKRASSGIVGVRVEQLACVRSISTELEGVRWCITFAIDCDKQKVVRLEDTPVLCREPYSLLVIPKARDHEYQLMVGEIKDNDPDNAFMLVWHTFHEHSDEDESMSDVISHMRQWVALRRNHPLMQPSDTKED